MPILGSALPNYSKLALTCRAFEKKIFVDLCYWTVELIKAITYI